MALKLPPIKRMLLVLTAIVTVMALVVVVRGIAATVNALSRGAEVRPERAEATATDAPDNADPSEPNAAAGEATAERGGHKSVADRAAELGVTKHEIRERIATRKGHTLEEQRDIWRERGEARKEARQGARDEERTVDREQLQRARAEITEQDPTVRDAAQVLKQLGDVGDGAAGPAQSP